MITPTSGSILIPSASADGIWITNLNIASPAVNRAIQAQISICPFNSQTGQMYMTQRKNIFINDVGALATSSSLAANAMEAIFAFVQDQVVSKSLF